MMNSLPRFCFFDQNDGSEENSAQNLRNNNAYSKVKRRDSLSYKKCVIFKFGVMCCLVIVLNLNTVMADPEFNDTDLWQVRTSLERNSRKISCKSEETGEEGFCTFAIDCTRANGTHLGACKDKFFFGSCCRISNKTALNHFIENVNIIHKDRTHNQTMQNKVHTMMSSASTSEKPLIPNTESHHSNKTLTYVKETIHTTQITSTETPKRETTVKHNLANNEKTTKVVPTPDIDSRGPEVATTKIPITNIEITDATSVASEASLSEPLEDSEDTFIMTPTKNVTSESTLLTTVSSTTTSTNNVNSESTLLTTVSSTSSQTISTTTTSTTTTSRPFFPNRPFRPFFQNFLSQLPGIFRPKPAFLFEPETISHQKLSPITMEPLSTSLRITTTETPIDFSPSFSKPSTTSEEISTEGLFPPISSLTSTILSTTLSMEMADETTKSAMATVFNEALGKITPEKVNLDSLEHTSIVIPSMNFVYESATYLDNSQKDLNTEASFTHSTIVDNDYILPATVTETAIIEDWNTDTNDSISGETLEDDSLNLFSPVPPTRELDNLITSLPVQTTPTSITVDKKSGNTEPTKNMMTDIDSSTELPSTEIYLTTTSNVLDLNKHFNNFMTTFTTLDENKSMITSNSLKSEGLTVNSFSEESETTASFLSQFSNDNFESTESDGISTIEVTTNSATYGLTTIETPLTGTNNVMINYESDGISRTESTTSPTYESTITDTTVTENYTDLPPDFESELLLTATHHNGKPDLSDGIWSNIEENESGTLATFASESVTEFPYVSSDYEEACGRQYISHARINGGWDSEFGEWPWTLSLRRVDTSIYTHNCGAVLINENWAVTAAHCVVDVAPSEFLLRLGEYDISNENEPLGHIERGLLLIATHPLFDNFTYENDIALIRFLEPVRFQLNIVPVCIPDSDDDFVGKTAHVSGWGRTSHLGPIANVMQEVEVPVITNDECENMYTAAGYGGSISNRFICAGYQEGGFDSCEGDSGGPMVIERESDNRFVLSGIISWGIGCGDPNKPGVYTRISEHRDWIKQIIQF